MVQRAVDVDKELSPERMTREVIAEDAVLIVYVGAGMELMGPSDGTRGGWTGCGLRVVGSAPPRGCVFGAEYCSHSSYALCCCFAVTGVLGCGRRFAAFEMRLLRIGVSSFLEYVHLATRSLAELHPSRLAGAEAVVRT